MRARDLQVLKLHLSLFKNRKIGTSRLSQPCKKIETSRHINEIENEDSTDRNNKNNFSNYK